MKIRFLLPIVLILVLVTGCAKDQETTDTAEGPQVSGRIEGGLRVLTVDPASTDQLFLIYRGDYVRLELVDGSPFTVEIPERETVKRFPAPDGEKPYIKFPDAGTFPFTIGDLSGTILALEFSAPAYREVGAQEGADLIANLRPFILDVRTPREFAAGHIEGAELIPIQQFQTRVGELDDHRNDPVFVYCKSGNRSTVAAKVLVDAGFKQVINLRRGIGDWTRQGLPTVSGN